MKAQATIPGKVMLAGEYCVLKGGRALASTVRQSMRVAASSSADGADGVLCSSNLYREQRLVHVTDSIDDFFEDPYLETVVACLKRFGIRRGSVQVDSQLDVRFGMGSSSALRLGVTLALARIGGGIDRDIQGASARDTSEREWGMARHAFALQRNHQKIGSGYDVATQLLGGVVLMEPPSNNQSLDMWPGEVARLSFEATRRLNEYVHVFVGGAGARTGAVALDTQAWLEKQSLERRFLELSDQLVDAFLGFLKGDLTILPQMVGACANHRTLLMASPHFPVSIAAALDSLPGRDELWSYKTTGAGGEDAILVISKPEDLLPVEQTLQVHGWDRLDAPFDNEGAVVTRQRETEDV